MSNIKVSVVIPIYNVEKYVRESVLSIINQTLKEIEVILVNDGSTDSSLAIIEALARQDNRVQIISNPNQGQSIARNLGIYRAKGEYIYFFDSDDLLEKETLEICYNKCQQEKLDFLFFDADVFSEENLPTDRFKYERASKYNNQVYIGKDILKQQLDDNIYSVSPCLNFINRQYLNDINLYFYPKILHEDELFTFILYLKAQKVGLINKSFFHRRIRPNSIMTTVFDKRNITGYLTVCRELKSYYAKYSTNNYEKNLVKKRINQLLNVIITKLKYIPNEEQGIIKKTITHEFGYILNLRTRIRNNAPRLFDLVYNIKKQFITKFSLRLLIFIYFS